MVKPNVSSTNDELKPQNTRQKIVLLMVTITATLLLALIQVLWLCYGPDRLFSCLLSLANILPILLSSLAASVTICLSQVITHLYQWFPFAAWVLLVITLAVPILTFYRFGWHRRRESILADFNEEASDYYLKQFHPSYQDTDSSALKGLENYYNTFFTRSSYLAPLCFLILTTGVLLAPCAASLSVWIQNRTTGGGPFPLIVVLALAGGYMWCLFDLLHKSFTDLLLPRDLYWGTFRLWISVPVGYSVGDIFDFKPDLGLAVAFCLGALPTWDIVVLLRLAVYRLTKSGSTDQDTQSQLRSLPSVDLQAAEMMRYEGITSIYDLSNCDPVRLTIRMGKQFSNIIGMIEDAILWNYLGRADYFDLFRQCGVNGAYDCKLLQNDLENEKDTKNMRDAIDVVKHLASKLSVPDAGIYNLVWNVAHDPITTFIYYLWNTDESVGNGASEDERLLQMHREWQEGRMKQPPTA